MAQHDAGFFLRVFDSISEPLAVYDQHYRLNLVNQALVNLYQMAARDIIGKHCYEVFQQRQAVCPGCQVEEVFRTGAPQQGEMVIDLPGGPRQFVIHCYPVFDAAGQITRVIQHRRDITEPQRLKRELGTWEARYQTLVDHAREGIFLMDNGQGRLTFASRSLGEMLGYDPAEIQGRSLLEFMDEDMATAAQAWLENGGAGAAGVDEFRFRKKDGSALVARLAAAPMQGEAAPGEAMGLVTDITREKQMEAELRGTLELNEKIIDSITDHLAVIDPRTYQIIQANHAFLERLGLEPEVVLGNTCFAVLYGKSHPCFEEGIWCPLQETLRLQHGAIGERGYTDAQGRERVMQVSTYPLFRRGAEVERVLRLETDITDKRQAEGALACSSRELQRTQDQLETLFDISRQVSEKNSLGELLAFLHELLGRSLAASEALFLILDSGREHFLPLTEAGDGVAAPLGRFLADLEGSGSRGEFIHYLKGAKGGRLVRKEEGHKLPACLPGLMAAYRNWFGLPICVHQECIGYFLLGSAAPREYPREDLHFVHALFQQIAGYIRHLVIQEARAPQVKQPEDGKTSYGGIIGKSKKMQEIYELIELISKSDATVLITGGNGTGKEMVAKAIHGQSHRHRGPFVVANCSAYSPSLLESELFGHERGAFTGAIRQRKGRIERSHGGTLFLDEIGDISPATQVLLLRFLQDHCFERVGGERPIEADVRVLAATHRDLRRLAEEGGFRDDLYYRLNVISIHLPLLKERKEDLPLLAEHFLRKYNHKEGKRVATFAADAMEALLEYEWPGNVRQLENAVSHALILAQGEVVRRRHLPRFLREAGSPAAPTSLAENERQLIIRVLQEANWNKHDAARRLQVSRSTLYSKIRRYGLEKNLPGSDSIQ